MKRYQASADLLDSVQLSRLGPAEPAGLLVTSLPLPRDASPELSLGSLATHSKPLGQWWDVETKAPRRVLLMADGGNQPADSLSISRKANQNWPTPVPQASAVLFAQSEAEEVHWERHTLKIQWQGRSIELAMGMRVDGETRWWEYCRLVKLSETPGCLEVEMAGCIPHMMFDQDSLRKYPGYSYPGLHVHHWLNGHIYARLYANGVCEIFAHHTNTRFVDDGGTLEKTVPTVGIRCSLSKDDVVPPQGDWDGSQTQWNIGGVAIDLSHVGHLANKELPGNVTHDGEFLILQPYLGVDMFGGICPQQRTGDPFIFRAKDQYFPKGMGRTLRFSLSLNPQRSARIAHYLPPAWWYGLCEEFSPQAYLPVVDELDKKLRSCQSFLRDHMVRDGFEDGSLPRGLGQQLEGRHEPGWEGEAAGAALLLAYRTGEAQDYDDAMRASYCFTDLYLDHATKLARMHGYAPNALNVPMSRVHACIFAYLETGDLYCLNAAKSIVDGAYWTHKNSWPRLAVGRDACFVRGAMCLFRYFKDARALEIARDTIHDVAQSQMPEGWFGDQGGGSGIHAWAAYICKPWMGLMAVGGLLDYLELFPDDNPDAINCVKRFADWLMRERFDHKGVMGWSYQHHFNNKRTFRFAQDGRLVTLPTENLWHMDYLARLMTYCTLRYGDVSYYDAWLESYQGSEPVCGGDHTFAQSIQYLPWTQAMTWRARWENGRVTADPLPLTQRAPQEGTVLTPAGPVKISRAGVAQGAGV